VRRANLFIWGCFRRPVLAIAVIYLFVAPCAATLFYSARFWRSRWVYRFALRVRRFRTARSKHVSLYYAPELAGRIVAPDLLRVCEAVLDWLSQRFGFSLGSRTLIFLFARPDDVGQAFGSRSTACAFNRRSIALPYDDRLLEVLRHELVHLFAWRWNANAPPILREGLSVWLQRTEGGEPIDMAAWHWQTQTEIKIDRLLSPEFFFDPKNCYACYMIAGSFTGYLIERFGWDSYRNLYSVCDGTGFRRKFEKCLGTSFDVVAQQWRQKISPLSQLYG